MQVGAHPNGLAYDPDRRLLLSFNLGEPLGENCTASVIDLDSGTVAATIGLPGRPRWAAYDAASGQIYVNIRQLAQSSGPCSVVDTTAVGSAEFHTERRNGAAREGVAAAVLAHISPFGVPFAIAQPR